MSNTQGDSFQLRGYMVLNAASYLRDLVGEPEATRIFDGFSPQARQVIGSAKPADWCPVSVFSELTRALATVGNGNDDRARETLINCGVFMAREASNTFLRILLKMLTPGIFVKKIPDIWGRDCNRGKLVPELTDQKLVCRTYEMEGFDHAVCTAAGFVTFVLQTMGKSIQKTTVHDWSVQKPAADGARFEIVWTS